MRIYQDAGRLVVDGEGQVLFSWSNSKGSDFSSADIPVAIDNFVFWHVRPDIISRLDAFLLGIRVAFSAAFLDRQYQPGRYAPLRYAVYRWKKMLRSIGEKGTL